MVYRFWPVHHLHSDVHIEGDSLVERFRAVRAHVLLFVTMDFQMTTQVAFIIKQLVAFGALRCEFLGAFMHRHMVLVVAELREALTAFVARVTWRLMRTFMSIQNDCIFEYFVAHRASQVRHATNVFTGKWFHLNCCRSGICIHLSITKLCKVDTIGFEILIDGQFAIALCGIHTVAAAVTIIQAANVIICKRAVVIVIAVTVV